MGYFRVDWLSRFTDEGGHRMPATKRALAPAGATQPNATISVSPAVDPGTGLVTVSVYDGTRQPIQQGTQILLTVADGAQKQLYRDYVGGPSISLKLPFHNNFADNYSIVTWAKGYEQAGFQPVKIGPNAPVTLDLMLLPKAGRFHFAQAGWNDLSAQRPGVAQIFAKGAAAGNQDPATAYGDLMENQPPCLA